MEDAVHTKVSDRVSTFTRGSIDEGIRTAATRKDIPSTALNDVDTSIAPRYIVKAEPTIFSMLRRVPLSPPALRIGSYQPSVILR